MHARRGLGRRVRHRRPHPPRPEHDLHGPTRPRHHRAATGAVAGPRPRRAARCRRGPADRRGRGSTVTVRRVHPQVAAAAGGPCRVRPRRLAAPPRADLRPAPRRPRRPHGVRGPRAVRQRPCSAREPADGERPLRPRPAAHAPGRYQVAVTVPREARRIGHQRPHAASPSPAKGRRAPGGPEAARPRGSRRGPRS